MPRIALINICFGFFTIGISAAAGAFIATDLTNAFRNDPTFLSSWMKVIQQSSHGHTTLFGLLHVIFGVTIPYSALSASAKVLQTAGFAAGVFAMGPLMIARSLGVPTADFDMVGILIGICLTGSLCSILSHSAGVLAKLRQH